MGQVNRGCQVFAYLMLDQREPVRSGLRLIEWAATCRADGVILPWAELARMSRLVTGARAAGLICYVELQPQAAAPTVEGVDGYYLDAPESWSRTALQQLGHVMIRIEDAAQAEQFPHLDFPTLNFLYVDRGQPVEAWMALCQARQQAGGRLPAYWDDTLGVSRAIERTAYAPLVVKRLALNREDGGSAQGGALLPYEFGELVRIALGIREQVAALTAALTGMPSMSVAPVARNGYAAAGRADIAIVIRSKNEAKWIGRVLEQIARQSRQPKEVILVDNDSTDDTVAIARSFEPRLPMTIVTIPDREFNFSRALNQGIEQATASWVISLSAHCVPLSTGWLAAFERETLEASAPFLAGVYGRQEPVDGLTSDFDKRDLWTTFRAERRVQHGQDFFFHNANSMIRRILWVAFPFDETIHGVEDQDWAQRVLRNGYSLVYAPQASVTHHHGIHHGRNEARAKRVVKVIELIQRRGPVGAPAR